MRLKLKTLYVGIKIGMKIDMKKLMLFTKIIISQSTFKIKYVDCEH